MEKLDCKPRWVSQHALFSCAICGPQLARGWIGQHQVYCRNTTLVARLPYVLGLLSFRTWKVHCAHQKLWCWCLIQPAPFSGLRSKCIARVSRHVLVTVVLKNLEPNPPPKRLYTQFHTQRITESPNKSISDTNTIFNSFGLWTQIRAFPPATIGCVAR